jgi:succinate-semialdehyde dehydrogenase / glutarate-semialdehyde dehydrogenase
MAGNVGLLKHASNVTGCAIAIEDLLRDAGFDGDEFQTLVVGSDAVERIIADDRIRAVTLTGSEGAGMAVGAAASKAIKPSVLELGGSDPFIVLEDADLDLAVGMAVKARMQNNGQSCIAAKRFIIDDAVYDRFLTRFVAEVERLHVSDPMDENCEIGPLARADLRDEIHDQVERAVGEGARLMTGGRKLSRAGFYYAPTVLADVAPGSVAFVEEIFGPVAAVIRARDRDHAVALANDTSFGLGGAVFTQDIAKGEHVARELEVGCAFVNGMVKSDPRLPFGGVKRSGYGRELASFGIREFVNVKTVWIA